MSPRRFAPSFASLPSRLGRLLLVVACVLPLAQCINGSPEGQAPTAPTPPTPTPTPTLTSVAVTGLSGAATPGQTAQLAANASYSDGTTQTVTQQASWESANPSVATVSGAGLVSFVALGDADIRATYRSVVGSTRVTVSAAPVRRFPLAGTLTDLDNGRGVENVRVEVTDGADAGRTTTTDVTGAFALADLAEGTFSVRITHPYYEVVVRPVALAQATRLDLALKPVVNVAGLYGTYNVGLRVTQQNCEEPAFPAATGTLALSGNANGTGFRAVIVERGTTRVYNGDMRADGSFGGTGGGVFAGVVGPRPGVINRHDYTGTIEGRVTGTSVSGTEFVRYGLPCPGRILELTFSGSK
jgi:hypothetical protein